MEEIIEIELTTQEKINAAQSELIEIQSYLCDTDYIVLKEFEGYDVSIYGNYKEVRSQKRERYNFLISEIEALQQQLIDERNADEIYVR